MAMVIVLSGMETDIVASWWMRLNCFPRTYRSLSVQATVRGQHLCCSHAEMSSCTREIILQKKVRHVKTPSSPLSPLLFLSLCIEALGSWFLEACTACSMLSDTTVPLPGWQQDVVSRARESTWKGVNESAGTPSNKVPLSSLSSLVFLPHED